tara:strand:- start:213 stop:401 length:189 start_codon:yes stop_codon:yes gene_type:complete
VEVERKPEKLVEEKEKEEQKEKLVENFAEKLENIDDLDYEEHNAAKDLNNDLNKKSLLIYNE